MKPSVSISVSSYYDKSSRINSVQEHGLLLVSISVFSLSVVSNFGICGLVISHGGNMSPKVLHHFMVNRRLGKEQERASVLIFTSGIYPSHTHATT